MWSNVERRKPGAINTTHHRRRKGDKLYNTIPVYDTDPSRDDVWTPTPTPSVVDFGSNYTSESPSIESPSCDPSPSYDSGCDSGSSFDSGFSGGDSGGGGGGDSW